MKTTAEVCVTQSRLLPLSPPSPPLFLLLLFCEPAGPLSSFIKPLSFSSLHFYSSPLEVTAPPYHVCETGWGGFDIAIDIQFRDPALPTLRLMHYLKLYSDGAGPHTAPSSSGADKPVVSEQFDELVFNTLPSDPALLAALVKGPTIDPPLYPYAEHMGVVSSEADLIAIAAARKWIADRVEELEERLVKARAGTAALRHVHLGNM